MQNAVVYVATKRKYVEEALNSLTSLRANGGELKVYLKTTPDLISETERRAFDYIVFLKNPAHSFIDKHSFLDGVEEPRVMFLDGDTFVAQDLPPGFELLDRFDLAVAHAPIRFGGNRRAEETEVPGAFCEFNTGVIFARNTETVREAFASWPNYQREGDAHDQPSFMRLLWQSKLSFFVLTPEWNARMVYPVFVSGNVRILHARLPNMAQAADILNESNEPRTLLPTEVI